MFIYCLWFFLPGFVFDFPSTSQVIGWKSIFDMIYLVPSGTLNPNSVNQ